jgi:hypothetical protein
MAMFFWDWQGVIHVDFLTEPRANLDVMEEKKIMPLTGNEPELPSCPASSLATIPTKENSQLFLMHL